MTDRDVWEFDENSKRYEICYTPESIRHPAKMEVNLCREIIKRYSKPGDLILDVMAGVGTTIVEGMILGRNVIGIEYEQKFVDMAQANIDLVQKKMGFVKGLGKGMIIKGDSRRLSEVLGSGRAENDIFSPPFANQNSQSRDKPDFTADKNGRGFIGKKYSEDENNIGNLSYGAVDSVITSPPYANRLKDNKQNDGDPARVSYRESGTEQKDNIGNLSYEADSIITSPPYKDVNVEQTHMTSNDRGNPKNPEFRPSWKKKLEEGYADTKRPYSVDSVITSPPYEEGIGHGGGRKNKIIERSKGIWTQGQGSYSKSKENIGEMRAGTYLDAMLTIYKECFKVLKPNGTMVLVVKNFVRAGKQVRLDSDTIRLCERANFTFIRRHYRKIKNPSFWIQNAIIKWKKKHPNEEHPYPLFEDVLVFQKKVAEEAERES